MSWLVYRLTHSAFILGLVGFVGEISSVAVALLAGALADRENPRRIVLATQTLAVLQAFALAALVFTDRIDVATILILSGVLGIINGFDVPARQVFLFHLVESRDDLRSAVALNSLALDSARLVGPALGGMVIAVVGEWMCFVAKGVSYLAVIVAVLAMQVSLKAGRSGQRSVVQTVIEGIRYGFGFPPIRAILLLVGAVSFAGSPYAVLMPVMAATVLEGGPYTLGILMASTGLGALVAAFYLGSRQTPLGLDRLIVLGSSLFGLGLILFSLSRWLGLSALLLVVAGFGLTILMTSANTILLTIAVEDKRGRVMSLFALSFMGTVALGSLFTGSLASWIGVPGTIAVGGALCVLGSVIFLRQLPRLRADLPQIAPPPGVAAKAAAGERAATERMAPPHNP